MMRGTPARADSPARAGGITERRTNEMKRLSCGQQSEIATAHAEHAKEFMMQFSPIDDLRVSDVKYLARLVNDACNGAMTEMADKLGLESQ